MRAVSDTLDPQELRRQHQALDAVFSLIRSLGTTLDVAKVAKLSLMTVTGQILVRKAAFYLQYPGEDTLRLCQSLGVRRVRLSETRLRVPPALHTRLRDTGGVATLTTASGLSPAILAHFDYAAYLEDGDRFVGLLLLGGKLSGRDFDEEDLRLLNTMGMVMGAALQKAIVHEQVAESMRKLQEAEALRKTIIDHVSHEFNTPILVIKDSMDLFESAHPDMKQDLMHMHTEAVQRLEGLVRGILLVSDAENPSKEHEVTMDRDDLENSVVVPLMHRGKERDATTQVVFDDWGPVEVEVLASRFALAMESVLDNAWSFARDGDVKVVVNGYATSRTWWDEHDHASRLAHYIEQLGEGASFDSVYFADGETPESVDEVSDAVVVLEVIDRGIGVPSDQVGTIFEPFTQARNSPTRGVRGAGMGLTAARKLLRDMGGDLVVRSQEGAGSIFAIFLPAVPAN